jgi:hypothetical protein
VLRQTGFADADERRQLLGRPRPDGDQLERAQPGLVAERAEDMPSNAPSSTLATAYG